MKCYTIIEGGKLKKSIEPSIVKKLLDDTTIAGKKSLNSAHLGFRPVPIFTLKDVAQQKNSYSYGQVYLASAVTPWERTMRFGKTACLVLYKHSKFYPDKFVGDESEDVWMGRYNCLLVTREGKLALREIESGICYGIKGGKLTKSF
jgi:hypothetical protein